MKRGWKIALGMVGALVVIGTGGFAYMLLQPPAPAKIAAESAANTTLVVALAVGVLYESIRSLKLHCTVRDGAGI